jgi:hypothetical protein
MNDTSQQIAQLKDKIAGLENLRDVLGNEIVEQKITEINVQLHQIETVGGAVIQGDVTMQGGDFVGRDQHITYGMSADQLVRLFADIYSRIETHPGLGETDKVDLKTDVEDIQKEVVKGERADESFLARRLRNIQRTAPDILEVVLSTLTSPAAGFATVARKHIIRCSHVRSKRFPLQPTGT